MRQLWRPVPGFPGYEASSTGQIKTPFGKIAVQTPTAKGYLRVNVRGKMTYVHRLVGLAFCPNPEKKSDINHKDGRIQNNGYKNLEWATRRENVQHGYDSNGRVPTRGERQGSAKLNEEKVRQIRLLAKNRTLASLAREFHVGETAINDIVHFRKWRHV